MLLVDDYADAVELLTQGLEDAGYEVLSASNGAAALEILERVTVSVVVLDIGLPGIDGYEVARLIRSLPKGQGVFLVALTGHGDARARRLSTEAGFDLHLVKPVDLERLATVIAERSRH